MHGNSNQNNKPHHLYKIHDTETDNILKYGISDNPIGKDGLSKRIRIQLGQLNLGAGWLRYFGKILMRNIAGRTKAKKLEKEHIDAYKKKFGRKPRGNKD